MPLSTPAFAFVGSPLNRRAEWRSLAGDFAEKGPQQCVWVRGDGVEMLGNDLRLDMPTDQGRDVILLGQAPTGVVWFATLAEAGAGLSPLRGLMQQGVLGREELAILAQARSLVHWHESHGFCAKCGAASTLAEQGYRRHCETCKADHFPRTDPVVIMAVRHGENLLLGRQANWPVGMYSSLAGFLEPGETIEEAVAREVFEEAGLRVSKVSYVASQPWPFPASLMIGVIAEADDSEIVIDGNELEDARWFSRVEVQAMLDGTHAEGFVASHPYAIAHHLIRAALE